MTAGLTRRSCGDTYCGGQIEASLRKVLGTYTLAYYCV